MDLGGNDLVWRNKPELPAANEENRKLEEMLRQKKIEVERLKLVLENNITKGKNMQEHFNNLAQMLSYKQQLYKTKEHELEMEVHATKVIERECSRLEQETKILNRDIESLTERQERRKAAIKEQNEKRDKLKSAIQMDEDTLLSYLQKSSQMEKDNMALLKYTSEDDSKINELVLHNEKLSKELHERKRALDEADTEVFIVQSELDKMQEEFKNAYVERNKLIANWEKVMNQIAQRNDEIAKSSEYIAKMREEQRKLKREEKEQLQLLSSEIERNNNLESEIKSKDKLSTKLHNDIREAKLREEDLLARLATSKNVSNNLLYQKQVAENTLIQLDKQLDTKNQKIEDTNKTNKKLEKDIETLIQETFEADHYIKELENLLQKENLRYSEIQKQVAHLTKDTITCAQDFKKLKEREKYLENQTKNAQADIRNANAKIVVLDRLRARQESEMYEIESNFEKLQRRVKKMAGVTNEEEKRKVEAERSQLLSTLEEKKKSLAMLTEELKIMMEKIALSTKELETNKKSNLELGEKIKSLEFYITNSQKALKASIARKQELLVQECCVKFQMKRHKMLLNSKNKSVLNLQTSKAKFQTMMKERMEELKNCNDLLEAEIKSEEDECTLLKKKLYEANDKIEKMKTKYKVIMDALGVTEPGESAESELLLKAEEKKRNLQLERDKLKATVLKNEEDLSALKNTLWAVNVANEQFRQVIYPRGISLEDSEALRNSEEESQALAIKLHASNRELKNLEDNIQNARVTLKENQQTCKELQEVINDRETKHEKITKELNDLDAKIMRADKMNSRLSLGLKKDDKYSGIEDDIRIHLLREIRRTVSDLLFATVESHPEISAKIQQLFEEANIPMPARARSTLYSRGSSRSSVYSRTSSKPPVVPKSGSSSGHSTPSSQSSSRMETISPSVVTLGAFPPESTDEHEET